MDSAQLQSSLDDVIPRWVYPVVGVGCSLAAAYSVWEHRLRNWDWAQDALIAFVSFSFSFRLGTQQPQRKAGGREFFGSHTESFLGRGLGISTDGGFPALALQLSRLRRGGFRPSEVIGIRCRYSPASLSSLDSVGSLTDMAYGFPWAA